jgi:dienelactone hydrolase
MMSAESHQKSSFAIIFTVLVVFFMNGVNNASADIISNKLVKINTREGVSQSFILVVPEYPIASVVLLDGYGDYKMGSLFGKPHVGGQAQNDTLVRIRDILAKNGLMVVLMDKPSDHRPPPQIPLGMTPGFRLSSEHMQDMSIVVEYVKKLSDKPLYVIGMCMGALSAVNAGIHIEKVDGLILISAVTKPNPENPYGRKFPNGIIDLDLEKIKKPAAVIYNEKDECRGTPPAKARLISDALVNAYHVETISLNGGSIPISDACHSLSYHGFYGLEKELAGAIINFIKPGSDSEDRTN